MKYIKNEFAFTLVEMLVVLLIITVILLIAIPNITSHSSSINEKGCQALKKMLETQVQAYEIEFKQSPKINDLLSEGFLTERDDIEGNQLKCPNGKILEISGGKVIES